MPFFKDALEPRVLFVDVSFPNRLIELADLTGHLTPATLSQELETAVSLGLGLPQIVPVHLSYEYREEIAEELAHAGSQLGIDLVPGLEDTELVC